MILYEFTWKLVTPIANEIYSPTTIFEKFFTDNIL